MRLGLSRVFPSSFPNKILYPFLFAPLRATCSILLILHDSAAHITNYEINYYEVFSNLLLHFSPMLKYFHWIYQHSSHMLIIFLEGVVINRIAINSLLYEPQGLLPRSQKVVTEPSSEAVYTT